ncbi:MAG: alpha/beta hydrolase-fold protein [Planctomycetaceae bacterium]
MTQPESYSQSFQSPEVHPDGAVTLRLQAPSAKSVDASIAGITLTLRKDASGLWEATTKPLEAGIHDYSFTVDGTRMIDPSNRMVKKWFTLASMVEIPGQPPLQTEFQDVPHGIVHRSYYQSTSVGHLRPVVVYTPPGYSETSDQLYPLLLLMHGYGDDETAWTEVGRAHLIVDNLIAMGEIQPIIVAMPFGHPVPVKFGERPDDYFGTNNEAFEKDLTRDLLPYLESTYRVQHDADGRFIAGLSMGGGHAIDTGLKNTDTFSAIGAFSAATPGGSEEELVNEYPSLSGPQPSANRLKHFWIPIGTSDFLLDRNDGFTAQLTKLGITHTYKKTDGGHEWKLWRKYLPEFLKLVVPKS